MCVCVCVCVCVCECECVCVCVCVSPVVQRGNMWVGVKEGVVSYRANPGRSKLGVGTDRIQLNRLG